MQAVTSAAGSLDSEPAFSAPRYDLVSTLGAGGMGEVALCRDGVIGREVAMKFARVEGGMDRRARARFLREARVQGRLEHPSIVPVYDIGQMADGQVYFTMRRVRGRSLEVVLEHGVAGDVEMRRLLNAFQSVCLAVEFAHSHGVVHRDLKPGNVMIGDFGEVYVLDWGIAKVEAHEDVASAPELEPEPLRTSAGEVLGTPGYMAPEQARGDSARVDARADIYALGAILFEILAGVPLHVGRTPAELLRSTLAGADARTSARGVRSVAPELEAICVRATQMDPSARFESARALHDAVERYLAGDRDMQRRRELALEHSRRAEALSREAIVAKTELDETAKRKDAMREIGTALGLDPTQPEAIGTLVDLLTRPPQHTPEAVLLHKTAEERVLARSAARPAAVVMLSILLVLTPLSMLMGVRNPASVVGGTLCFLAAGLLALRAGAVGSAPSRRVAILVFLLAGLLAMGWMFGPFMLVPQLTLAIVTGLVLYPSEYRASFITATGLLAIVLPLALAELGWIPPFYEFGEDRMCLVAKAFSFPRVPTTLYLTFSSCMAIVGTVGYLQRVRARLDEAQMRLRVYAWQLRQVMPERPITDPSTRPVPDAEVVGRVTDGEDRREGALARRSAERHAYRERRRVGLGAAEVRFGAHERDALAARDLQATEHERRRARDAEPHDELVPAGRVLLGRDVHRSHAELRHAMRERARELRLAKVDDGPGHLRATEERGRARRPSRRALELERLAGRDRIRLEQAVRHRREARVERDRRARSAEGHVEIHVPLGPRPAREVHLLADEHAIARGLHAYARDAREQRERRRRRRNRPRRGDEGDAREPLHPSASSSARARASTDASSSSAATCRSAGPEKTARRWRAAAGFLNQSTSKRSTSSRLVEDAATRPAHRPARSADQAGHAPASSRGSGLPSAAAVTSSNAARSPKPRSLDRRWRAASTRAVTSAERESDRAWAAAARAPRPSAARWNARDVVSAAKTQPHMCSSARSGSRASEKGNERAGPARRSARPNAPSARAKLDAPSGAGSGSSASLPNASTRSVSSSQRAVMRAGQPSPASRASAGASRSAAVTTRTRRLASRYRSSVRASRRRAARSRRALSSPGEIPRRSSASRRRAARSRAGAAIAGPRCASEESHCSRSSGVRAASICGTASRQLTRRGGSRCSSADRSARASISSRSRSSVIRAWRSARTQARSASRSGASCAGPGSASASNVPFPLAYRYGAIGSASVASGSFASAARQRASASAARATS
jgi:serine/threonine-protein kinase